MLTKKTKEEPIVRFLGPGIEVITKREMVNTILGVKTKKHLVLKILTVSESIMSSQGIPGNRLLIFQNYPMPLYESSVLIVDDEISRSDINLLKPITQVHKEWSQFISNPLFTCKD